MQVSSVGTPPRAIHGPSRLSRHPCREAHCAEPPLGLPMGRVDQMPLRRPTGRPAGLFGCGICDRLIFSVGAGLARDAGSSFYLEEHSAAIAGKPVPTGDWCCLRFLLLLLLLPLDCPGDANAPHRRLTGEPVLGRDLRTYVLWESTPFQRTTGYLATCGH